MINSHEQKHAKKNSECAHSWIKYCKRNCSLIIIHTEYFSLWKGIEVYEYTWFVTLACIQTHTMPTHWQWLNFNTIINFNFFFCSITFFSSPISEFWTQNTHQPMAVGVGFRMSLSFFITVRLHLLFKNHRQSRHIWQINKCNICRRFALVIMAINK